MESEKSGYSLTVQGFRGKWRGIQKMRKRNKRFEVKKRKKRKGKVYLRRGKKKLRR